MNSQKRYILLTSAKDDRNSSRSFNEFTTTDSMSKVLVNYYESYLKDLKAIEDPGNKDIAYTSDDLDRWIDEFFGECNCLEVQDEMPNLFIPYATEWVKEQVFLYLRSRVYGKEAEVIQIDGVAMDVA